MTRGSTLDLAIKTLASLPNPPQDLIRELPGVYRLRNRVIHGEDTPTGNDQVKKALARLDVVLFHLGNVPKDILERVVATMELGVKGARVLSHSEINTRLEASANQVTQAQSGMLEHDFVAILQSDGNYAIRQFVGGRLIPVATHAATYGEADAKACLAALIFEGDGWIEISSGVSRLMQP